MEKDKDCNSLATETTDEKTVQSHNKEKELLASKSAPLTTLESLEIASRTMSRQRTHHSIDEEKNEKEIEVFRQQPYHTEGLRNPGWLAVISCFLGTFVVYGIMYSWGNYQKLYVEDIFAGRTDLFKIAFVGTSSSALSLAFGLFTTPVIQKLGFRGTMMIGTILCPVSLILASFATNLWEIYMTQGILAGIGGAFVFTPAITLPSQWFTSRRGLATGLAISGSGVGGVCFAPLAQYLIDNLGYRDSLRVLGAISFTLLCISTALATSRYRPPLSNNGQGKWYHIVDFDLINLRFILLFIYAFFAGFGYLAPFFLAPQYAQHVGMSTSAGAAMISVMSATNAFARISLGYLADKFGKLNALLSCTFVGAGGFVSLLPVITGDIVGVENIQRGIGMIYLATVAGDLLGTPIVGLLRDAFDWTAAIQFAGSANMAAALFLLALRMDIAYGHVFVKI
ncbi:hypothetical protein G6F46_006741 [Rhizopus delemar]|nr:hypothetical protein G6F54_007641 [Rhizopus delemar]KAG1508647.1 hypothetical protein G6F53_008039 [Rhizopus delemar]KAG1550369.1 hypothetical protein G6F49_009317 [Rhizopus delemar]KAG1593571.1 hypothetical protein G6F48_001911 [Rhizopus delemar]KAG1603425.1 hypothetical protein G6F47_001854 [Rhizopus delemar]